LPFYCDTDRATNWFSKMLPQMLSAIRGTDKDKKKKGIDALTRILSPALMIQKNWAGLHVARISKNTKVDRVADFYSGKFRSYYCGQMTRPEDFGPHADALAHPDFASSLNVLQGDPEGISSWLGIYRSIYFYLVGEEK